MTDTALASTPGSQVTGTPATMPTSIIDVRTATAAEWDAAWSGCDFATFFQSREWMTMWCSLDRHGLWLDPQLLTFSDGTQATLPLCSRSMHKGLVRAHCVSAGGAYGGWLSAAVLGAEHAACLTRHVLHLGNVEWLTNPFDPSVLADGTISGKRDATDALALHGGIDAVVKRWTKGHRSAVPKAIRAGVAVRQAESIDDWRKYYELYRHSVQRWGESATSDHPLELFEALCKLESRNVVLWLATLDREIVAGAVCLYASKQVSYWHGAALEAHFHMRPVNLLLHAAITDACARGKDWFDFGLSGGHEGVRAFKKSFGAEPLPCIYVESATRWRRLVGAVVGLKDRVVA